MSTWVKIGALDSIPKLGARIVRSQTQGDIAIFRNDENKIFALRDKCPHKGGPLSQGMVHGNRVTCPLHGWHVGLDNGNAVEPDKGCVETFPIRLEDGQIWLEV